MTVLSSWREQDIILNDNTPTEIYFRDSEPNHIVITNTTEKPMYISESSNVNPSFHEMSIPAGGTKMFAKPKVMNRFYIWHADAGEDKIHIVSFSDEFNPQSVAQTQEIVNTQQITGTMDIVTMPEVKTTNPLDNYGLSTSTKPTTGLRVGSTFFEIDTTKVFMWDGSQWREI
jgi:hypothetical protein